MKKINFLMCIHCHQPVDNFGNIFEKAYEKSYEPFIAVLERHPGVRLALHYSGSLLDWIVGERPDFIGRIKKLIRKSQVEILTGGYFEPVLPMVPEKDAKGQIEMLTRLIEKLFGYSPSGIWLAERVWDPKLAPIFKDLNIKFTILDDFHFNRAGVKENQVLGHYSIKGLENFCVFASMKKLRYAIPFRDPAATMNILKQLRDDSDASSAVFADDCEKFGFWPRTYEWVYRKKWLENFFSAIEENDWINTSTFTETLNESGPAGEIEIPAASYAEMMEWSGGNFGNFFKKYPESERMRERMSCVSRKINEQEISGKRSDKERIESAKTELYKAQSNCAYWHGVFGGIYMNFLRHGVYSHIIRAEEKIAADNIDNKKVEEIDFPGGEGTTIAKKVIHARNKSLGLFIDPDYGGSLFELDYRPLSYNLVNTMSRRPEPYHGKLDKKRKISVSLLKKKVDEDQNLDLHEVVGIKELNLKRFLNYDSYRKTSLLCHAMDAKTSFSDFVSSKHGDAGDEGLFGPYKHDVKSTGDRLTVSLVRDGTVRMGGKYYLLSLTKCVILEKGPEIVMKFDLENLSPGPVKLMFGAEFNWSVEDDSFLRPRREKKIKEITLVDKFYGIKINHTFEDYVNLWSFPVYTVNETESGLGKNFQEISLLFNKIAVLGKNEKFSMAAKLKISTRAQQ